MTDEKWKLNLILKNHLLKKPLTLIWTQSSGSILIYFTKLAHWCINNLYATYLRNECKARRCLFIHRRPNASSAQERTPPVEAQPLVFQSPPIAQMSRLSMGENNQNRNLEAEVIAALNCMIPQLTNQIVTAFRTQKSTSYTVITLNKLFPKLIMIV